MDYACERTPYLREVDTNAYLPQVSRDAKEMIAIHAVNDKELEEFWRLLNDLYYNRFICSADADGLSRYEKLLGITKKGDLSERRRRVHYEWNKQVVYTDRSLRQMMTDLLGKSGFSMRVVYDEYTVRFEINVNNASGVSQRFVYDELRRIIPANMWIEFGIYWESALVLETSYTQYLYRYVLCGERKCGTIPWYQTRGVTYPLSLVVDIKDREMRQMALLASDRTILNKATIYPKNHVSKEIILNDKTPWDATDKDYPVLESGQYR